MVPPAEQWAAATEAAAVASQGADMVAAPSPADPSRKHINAEKRREKQQASRERRKEQNKDKRQQQQQQQNQQQQQRQSRAHAPDGASEPDATAAVEAVPEAANDPVQAAEASQGAAEMKARQAEQAERRRVMAERAAALREATRREEEECAAAKAKEEAKARAEAAAAAKMRETQRKIAKAGSAYALLMEDEATDDDDGDGDDADEGSSSTDDTALVSGMEALAEAPFQGVPDEGLAKLYLDGDGILMNGDRMNGDRMNGDRMNGGGMRDASRSRVDDEATPLPGPADEAVVHWGSDKEDTAARRHLSCTAAAFSKKGEHKLHANEDRYTLISELNVELAKRPAAEASRAPAGSEPPSHGFYAVYDGHGGSECASYASSNLHLHLDDEEERWREEPAAALRAAFVRSELELRAEFERSGSNKSGTCALAALMRGHRLIVANLGDCRALLLRSQAHPQSMVQLTTDQRATEPAEHKRITSAGGHVVDGRVLGVLIPSRTLGDFPWKDREGGGAISSEPEVIEYAVQPEDKYLVIGSDGLFDVLSNKMIGRIVCKMGSSAQRVCNEIVKELKKKVTNDDVTILVIQFHAPEAPK